MNAFVVNMNHLFKMNCQKFVIFTNWEQQLWTLWNYEIWLQL